MMKNFVLNFKRFNWKYKLHWIWRIISGKDINICFINAETEPVEGMTVNLEIYDEGQEVQGDNFIVDWDKILLKVKTKKELSGNFTAWSMEPKEGGLGC